MAAKGVFNAFIDNLVTFPTIIFTGLVIFVVMYWLISLLGMADMDSFELDIADGLDAGDAISAEDMGFFSAVLFKFGLYGVPVVIMLSIFSLTGWFISYMMTLFAAKYVSGIILTGIGVVTLMLTVWLSAWITGKSISPFRKISEKRPKKNFKSVVGKVGTVRSSIVNDAFGEAIVEDGGGGLILKVRSHDITFKQGDRVVLIDYLADDNVYTVISEAEFKHG